MVNTNSLYRPLLVLIATSLLGVPASRAFNTGDIVVDNTRGEARLTQDGKERDVRRGQVVLVPSTLRTGQDGVVDLRQGATTVNVGPETVLEFPAAQARGEPVERIVQSRGNAFYDVGKREGRKLRVETPYLVAVIKGTQFSVSVQAESTSISLVEGSLEILASDGGATVDLEAGEVAIRRRGEDGVTVVDIDAAQVRVPVAGTADATLAANGERGAPGAVADVIVDGARTANGDGVVREVEAGVDLASTGQAAGVVAAVEVSPGVVATEIAAGAAVGDAAAVDLTTSVDVRADGVGVEAGTTVDVGAGTVGADAAVDLGMEVSGAGAGATAQVDVGIAAGPVDAGVDTSADIGLGTSGASVDAGLGAAVDVGSVSTGLDVGVAADLETSPSASVAVDAGVAGVDAGVTAGVDLGTGSIDVGVDLGGVNLDVGLDLDPVDETTDVATEGSSDGTEGGGLVENVGGLLDGLLSRPGRR